MKKQRARNIYKYHEEWRRESMREERNGLMETVRIFIVFFTVLISHPFDFVTREYGGREEKEWENKRWCRGEKRERGKEMKRKWRGRIFTHVNSVFSACEHLYFLCATLIGRGREEGVWENKGGEKERKRKGEEEERRWRGRNFTHVNRTASVRTALAGRWNFLFGTSERLLQPKFPRSAC